MVYYLFYFFLIWNEHDGSLIGSLWGMYVILCFTFYFITHSSGGMIETKLPKRIVCVDNADFWSTATLKWLTEGIHGVMNDCLCNLNLKYGTFVSLF